MRKETKQAIEDKKDDRDMIHAREIRGIVLTETSALEKTLKKRKDENDVLKALLNSAKCPHCDDTGVIPVPVSITVAEVGEDGHPQPVQRIDWEPSRCEWCHIKEEALND